MAVPAAVWVGGTILAGVGVYGLSQRPDINVYTGAPEGLNFSMDWRSLGVLAAAGAGLAWYVSKAG